MRRVRRCPHCERPVRELRQLVIFLFPLLALLLWYGALILCDLAARHSRRTGLSYERGPSRTSSVRSAPVPSFESASFAALNVASNPPSN